MGWTDVLKLVGGGVAAPFTGGATLPLVMQGVSGVLSGAAKGAAGERGNQNTFAATQDKTRSANYGTQQGALLDSLLAQGKDRMGAYDTRQGATTSAMQGLQGATTNALQNQSAEGLARARLQLDQNAQGAQIPLALARQSVMGSLMKNLQPHEFSSPAGQQGHLTNVKGGMSAADLDPMTREQGQALMASALEAQLKGTDKLDLGAPTDFMGGVKDWNKTILDAPEPVDYSKGLILPPELADYQKAGKLETGLGMGGLVSGLLGSLGGKPSRGGADDEETQDD